MRYLTYAESFFQTGLRVAASQDGDSVCGNAPKNRSVMPKLKWLFRASGTALQAQRIGEQQISDNPAGSFYTAVDKESLRNSPKYERD